MTCLCSENESLIINDTSKSKLGSLDDDTSRHMAKDNVIIDDPRIMHDNLSMYISLFLKYQILYRSS